MPSTFFITALGLITLFAQKLHSTNIIQTAFNYCAASIDVWPHDLVALLHLDHGAGGHPLAGVTFAVLFLGLVAPQFAWLLMARYACVASSYFSRRPLIRKASQTLIACTALLGLRAAYYLSPGVAYDARLMTGSLVLGFRGGLIHLPVTDALNMYIDSLVFWTFYVRYSTLHVLLAGVEHSILDSMGALIVAGEIISLGYAAAGLLFCISWIMRKLLAGLWITISLPASILVLLLQSFAILGFMTYRAIEEVLNAVASVLVFVLCLPSTLANSSVTLVLLVSQLVTDSIYGMFRGLPTTQTASSDRRIQLYTTKVSEESDGAPNSDRKVQLYTTKISEASVSAPTSDRQMQLYTTEVNGASDDVSTSEQQAQLYAANTSEGADDVLAGTDDKAGKEINYIHALSYLSGGEMVLSRMVFTVVAPLGHTPDLNIPKGVHRNIAAEIERAFHAKNNRGAISGRVDTHVGRQGATPGYTVRAEVRAVVLENFWAV